MIYKKGVNSTVRKTATVYHPLKNMDTAVIISTN